MKNCPKCGYSLNDWDTVCPKCQLLPDAAAITARRSSTPRQNGSKVGRLIVGVISLGICLWILFQIGALGDLKPAMTRPAQHSMYENFRVGYWGYRVEKMSVVQSLGNSASSEKPDGKFVVVFLTVENNDTTASTIPSPILKDGEGREHSSKMVFGSALPDEDLTITTLNPGVSKRGYFIFDVPKDAYDLQLVLSGGHQSGEKAAVNVY